MKKKNAYQRKVANAYQEESVSMNWKRSTEIMINAAEETVGFIEKKKRSTSERVQQLSQQQKDLKNKIDSSRNCGKRLRLRAERNQVLTALHNEIKKEEAEKINQKMEPLMSGTKDSRSMFNVMKELRRSKPKRKLLMKNKRGMLSSDEKENCEIIAEHFKNIFFKNAKQYPQIKPQPMKIPFTKDEVAASVWKMKNGKSTTDIAVELIKYAPVEVH